MAFYLKGIKSAGLKNVSKQPAVVDVCGFL